MSDAVWREQTSTVPVKPPAAQQDKGKNVVQAFVQ
jgi:hypothetical protein